MFIVELTYKVDLTEVEEHIVVHRNWLDRLYVANKLLCSGPKNPRDGGIIIILGNDIIEAESIIKEDPFYKYGLADYKITEVNVNKKNSQLEDLLI